MSHQAKVEGRRGGECSIDRAAADFETAMPLHKISPLVSTLDWCPLQLVAGGASTWRQDTATAR